MEAIKNRINRDDKVKLLLKDGTYFEGSAKLAGDKETVLLEISFPTGDKPPHTFHSGHKVLIPLNAIVCIDL